MDFPAMFDYQIVLKIKPGNAKSECNWGNDMEWITVGTLQFLRHGWHGLQGEQNYQLQKGLSDSPQVGILQLFTFPWNIHGSPIVQVPQFYVHPKES